jgi:hypothetical protein
MTRVWILALALGGVVAWGSENTTIQAAPAKKPGAQPAKDPDKKPADRRKRERFRGEGIIESIKSDSIVMKTKGGETLTLETGKNAKIRITGRVEREYLRVGQLVEISALVDKKSRRVKDRVKTLLLFTPSPLHNPGCFPDMSAPPVPAEANDDPSVNWKPYLVGGQIVAIKDDKLQLNVPDFNPRLTIDLDENVQIKFDVGDLTLTQPGDRIQVVKAVMLGENRVAVSDATIMRAEPLKTPPKPARTGKPAKPAAKSERK